MSRQPDDLDDMPMPEEQVTRRVEVTIKEAEVLKICPEPGDVLFFKFKGDHFYTDDVNELGKQLRALFPANKCVVMALPDGHDVELTTVANQGTVEKSYCADPKAYCERCDCGKKEKIESEGT